MGESQKSNNPLSLRNIFAGVLVTVVGGVILAFIVQDAIFAPVQKTAPEVSTRAVAQPTSDARVADTPAPVPTSTAIPNHQLTPTPTRTILPTETPAPTYSSTSSSTSGEVSVIEPIPFGQSKNLDGLVVNVGPPEYFAGCGGTLNFGVTLINEGGSPVAIGLRDISLLGDGYRKVSQLYGKLGSPNTSCYSSALNIQTVASNSEVKFALRTTSDLSDFEFLDLVFGDKSGRLAGHAWRLDLSQIYRTERKSFGESINVDGLVVSVGEENYSPGCSGTLGFQIVMKNTTNQSIEVGFNASDIKVYGDGYLGMRSLWWKLGPQSTECYSGGTRISTTLDPGATVLIAHRIMENLSEMSFVEIVFEFGGRLNGLRWRLNLPS